MKKAILFLFLLVVVPMTGYASEAISGNLQGYRMGACSLWSFTNAGMPGYLCNSYPQNVVVADAQSFANSIRELETRILELEKKIAELQHPTPQPQP